MNTDGNRTIETAVAGDGFLFDGTNWHHYVVGAPEELIGLIQENKRLKAQRAEGVPSNRPDSFDPAFQAMRSACYQEGLRAAAVEVEGFLPKPFTTAATIERARCLQAIRALMLVPTENAP